ncbi:MAG: tetratricopeptide repeat protein [Betaproteobacteria bacterium]
MAKMHAVLAATARRNGADATMQDKWRETIWPDTTLDLPIGTVTFLFTDIEGSTELWEHQPVEMGVSLARHDMLVREAIGRYDGRVFATGGDAFCAAFHTPLAALAAALDAQRALANETWPAATRLKVRMALHTGAAEPRANDYFGPPLNRVARLLSAGHGGQILLSLATQVLVRDGLPAEVTLRDMGERRLKDLIRPERVYQVLAPGLPAEFPPLRTLDARAHNLPLQLSSFVGREREMQDVKRLLSASRLVTLTGAGGAGKTRLALQVAADRIDDFGDGVWIAPLAPLTDPRLLPQAVAMVLGVKEKAGVSLTETLLMELRGKELLLILDNCEHVIDSSALFCQVLLESCACVRILATSREALRVKGESAYRVPSLATPDPKVPVNVASLTQYAAVQLFIDRALAASAAFTVDNANAPALASICHRLDGIPLAIELAAARIRSMSTEEVNQRLDQRFRLLTGGSRTALPRQQTLRALIDWSYDLLSAAEQVLFRRLAVFAGSWTLEAAEHVCNGDGERPPPRGAEQVRIDASDVLDLVASLTDKSLVVNEEQSGATRYRLMETVRQYARDRLREEGDEAQYRERHLAHFLALAELAEQNLIGAEQKAWLCRVDAEHDNLRAALAWSSTPGGDVAAGLRLAAAIYWFWLVRGHCSEGRDWLSSLLAAGRMDQAPAIRAKALHGAGGLAWQQGDFPAARAMFEASLIIRRELGDRRGIAATLNNLGNVACSQADYPRARALGEESLALLRELGNRSGVAASLSNLGNVAADQGDYAAARVLHEESLAIHRELGDLGGIAIQLNNVGVLTAHQCDYGAARAFHEECLTIGRELGDRDCIAMALNNLGEVACDEGDYVVARALAQESLTIFRELGERQSIAMTLNSLGIVAYCEGDLRAARALLEESLAIRRELGDRQGIAASLNNLGNEARDHGDHVGGLALHAESLAIYRELGDRRGIASSLEGFAEFALAKPDRAARMWGAAERLRNEIAVPLPLRDRARHESQLAEARAAIEDAFAFDQAWEEGRAMTLAQAIEYALEGRDV